MERREHLIIAIFIALLTLSSCGAPPTARNVVVICIDTLRADHLSCYGHTRETTPTIDALAVSGTRFTRAFAHSSWTVPATASLLTSKLPAEHGAVLPGPLKSLGEQTPGRIRPTVHSVAWYLAQQGYDNALFSANPFLQDRFSDGFATSVVERVDAKTLSGRAAQWLRKPRKAPFLLYLQYMDLHSPLSMPEEYLHHFAVEGHGPRNERHRRWRFRRAETLSGRAFADFKAHRLAAYDGALLYVDTEIGRLLDALRGAEHAANTLVIVTSDHGEEFWDHAIIEAELGGDPRGVYGIGHGNSMFQELLRVPLICAGPGLPEGLVIDEAVGHLAVAPTILTALGQPVPDAMAGSPLQTLWRNPEEWRPQPLVADSPAYGPDAAALVVGSHKLVVRRDGAVLLFDLDTDPHETHNLAPERPELVASLRRILEARTPRGESDEPSTQMPLDEATRDQLRELGYLK